MKVAIVGSRDFNDRSRFEEFIREICQENGYVIDTIISGGARGADHLAEEYAREHNLSLKVFPADWDKYGKSAGFRRNVDIISNCDVCFAFWDGQSHGTQHDIQLCQKMDKPCHICRYLEQQKLF